MSRPYWTLVVVVAWVACPSAQATETATPERGGISIGVSAAYNHLDGNIQASMVGYEVTGTIQVLGIYWWASQGFLWRFATDFQAFFYYEAGFWAVANLGAGFSVGGTRDPPVQLHLFVGLPIPAVGMDEPDLFPGFYVEPYYRPSVHITDQRATWDHEVGLILKLTTLKFIWPWQDDTEAVRSGRTSAARR